MTKKELLEYEMDCLYERNYPARYFDPSYIATNSTVAFIGFINCIISDWVSVLEKYTKMDMGHLEYILNLDAMKFVALYGEEIGDREYEVGKMYLDIVRKIMVGIFVTGETVFPDDYDDEVILYNIKRRMS